MRLKYLFHFKPATKKWQSCPEWSIITDYLTEPLPWTNQDETKLRFIKLIVTFILEQLSDTFYITQSRDYVNQFYHFYDWNMLVRQKINQLISDKKIIPLTSESTTEDHLITALKKSTKSE